jgi:hypothetical protein
LHGGVGLLRVFSDVLWVLVFVFLYSYGICSYTYQSAAELAHIVAKDGTKINIQESPSWGTWCFFVSLLFVPFKNRTNPTDCVILFFPFLSFVAGITGNYGVYDYGGYVIDLPSGDAVTAHSIVQQLQADKWLDAGTGGLVVTFTTYNPNLNLFSYNRILLGKCTPVALLVLQRYFSKWFHRVVHILLNIFAHILLTSLSTLLSPRIHTDRLGETFVRVSTF